MMTTGTTEPGSSEGLEPGVRSDQRRPWDCRMGYPPTRPSGQVNGLGLTLGSPANARGTAECGRSTAWGRAVCGSTARRVWEGGTGEVGRPGEMEHAPGGKPTGPSPSAAPATPNQLPTSPPPTDGCLARSFNVPMEEGGWFLLVSTLK